MRNISRPVHPAARAVVMASAASDERGGDHHGERVQAADQQAFALDLGVPEPRALLVVPVDAFLHGIHVDEGQHVSAGQ
jgi:hypothetical protein